MHQKFSKFSSPRDWPKGHSNFWQWIFWKLSASPSETTWPYLGLDKRKFKSDGWILRNLHFSKMFNHIVPCHDFHRFGRLCREILLYPAVLGCFYSRLYKPYWPTVSNHESARDERRNFEHCAQRRTPVDFEVPKPPEIALRSRNRHFSKSHVMHAM